MNTSAGRFLVLFGVIWSAMTLLFDGILLVPMARQLSAMNFPSTEGTILSSEVTDHEGEDGTTHGVSVRYAYSVGGHDYIGNRYRYDTSSSSDSAWAYRVVEARPSGTKVKVFYNPSRPEDAVLATGLLGSDLFQLTFMTPFNAAMLGFGWAGWMKLRQRWFKPPAGGVKIITDLRKTRARLNVYSPLAAGAATGTLLAFLSIFVICIAAGGFHPSMRTMIVTWSVILAGGIAAGVWHGSQIVSGKYDLIIDELGSALELPLTHGRKARRRVPFAGVQGVRVEKFRKGASDGQPWIYAPTLEIAGSDPESERLVGWQDEAKAQAFAGWLREKLPPKPSPQRSLAGRF
jgi:hypothetical protein